MNRRRSVFALLRSRLQSIFRMLSRTPLRVFAAVVVTASVAVLLKRDRNVTDATDISTRIERIERSASYQISPCTKNQTEIHAAAKLRWNTKDCLPVLPKYDSSKWLPEIQHKPNEPVIIFQYGKCGSSAMRKYFESQIPKIPVIHCHFFGGPYKDHNCQKHPSFPHETPNSTVWIVTMVRNRFIRDPSALMENHAAAGLTARTPLPKILEQFQAGVGRRGHGANSLTWYKDMFQPYVGVDLTTLPFNMSRRSLFTEYGRYRILLLRFEDISFWGDILPRFFPSVSVEFPVANPTSDVAWKQMAYDYILAGSDFSLYIKEYANGDTLKFYSGCERNILVDAATHPAFRPSNCTN